MITLTWQSVITAGAVVSAAGALAAVIAAVVRFFDRQKAQDTDLVTLREKHNADMKTLREDMAENHKAIMAEQSILTEGVLACLKGLQERGCNGPVTKAIGMIEDHLNKEAHR